MHFPTDTEALCHAKADAARLAGSSSGSSGDLVSISLVDVGGLFILQAAAVVLCLGISLITMTVRHCHQRRAGFQQQAQMGAPGARLGAVAVPGKDGVGCGESLSSLGADVSTPAAAEANSIAHPGNFRVVV